LDGGPPSAIDVHVVSTSVVLTISGLWSGEDILVSKLFNMYSRYAESQGWQMDSMPPTGSVAEPFKEVVAVIHGEKAYVKLRHENGVHRIQWVPPIEKEGRVFTAKLLVTVVQQAGNEQHLVAEDSGPIRTYNIPQNRATDHRIGLTLHQLDLVMNGNLEPIIQALTAHFGEDGADGGSGL
jgi:protein subunit release factor A